MRRLLGGKGANLAEMTSIGLPVPDGFTVTTEACLAYLANDGRHPDGLDAELGAHLAALEQRVGKRLGARERPAAGVGAVGSRGLDAGHDGHDPEPGHERRVGAGAGRGRRRRAVRIRLLPAVRADVRGRGRRRRRPPVRERAGADEDGPRRGRRRRPVGRRPARAGGRVPGDLPAGDRRAVPAGSRSAAATVDRRGVRLVEHAAGAHLPSRVPHRRRPGHRRERRADGVRQHGRRLGHRRLLHPQPVHR